MVTTQNNHERNVMLVQMIVCVAHEICHVLTGFLTGLHRPITPDAITVRGWPGGESGRWWELQRLGGVAEFYARRSDRNNPNQSGTPYLFSDYERNSLGTQISAEYIDRFALGSE